MTFCSTLLPFAPNLSRRGLIAAFAFFIWLSPIPSYSMGEIGGLGSTKWSAIDSHVTNRGSAMVSRSETDSKLFIWNNDGSVRAVIRSSGLIAAPHMTSDGHVLFIERKSPRTESTSRLYSVDLRDNQVKARLLHTSNDLLGWPISIESNTLKGVALITGQFFPNSIGNWMPKRKVLLYTEESGTIETEKTFSTIGHLSKIGEGRYLGVSFVPKEKRPEPEGHSEQCIKNNCLIDLSLSKELLSSRLYSKPVSVQGTLLGIGHSEVEGRFVLTSVAFPSTGGQLLRATAYDAMDGQHVFETGLPSGSDVEVGRPSLLPSQAPEGKISFIVASEKIIGRTSLEVWSVEASGGRSTKTPLSTEHYDTYNLDEITEPDAAAGGR